MRNKLGFTLIEVIVAMAILAIMLVTIMQLFSGGLKASRTSCNYTRAIVHAKDKMEELLEKPEQGSGDFGDGFEWASTIEPYKEPDDSQFKLLKVIVKISWYKAPEQQNSLELLSMKTIKITENEN
ncbi:MAG: prepilin-type N-terminal cleavage/methylation domain-containing protein [Nitrospirae bacterium]|nr:prepilin-type N-terminal cleavage/methylation domain-containing protein [Nitrospirota bacterium]